MQYRLKKISWLGGILLQTLICNQSYSHEINVANEQLKKTDNLNKSIKDNKLISEKFTHSFGFTIDNNYYHYMEPDVRQNKDYNKDGAIWVKWKGNTWGGSAFYKLTWQDKIFIQPEARLLYGRHQYVFGQKDNIFGKTNHSIPSLIFEPRLTLGGNLSVNKDLIISPYSGIGYRFKSDNGDDALCNDGDKLGFYRKSNYVYVPLGASAEYQLDHMWSVSLKGEYDWIVKAWHTDRSMGDSTMTFTQPNGYGLKGEVSVSYLYKKVKVSLTPYINYWNIRNSKRTYFMHEDYQTSSREPYNITWETGLKLGVSF